MCGPSHLNVFSIDFIVVLLDFVPTKLTSIVVKTDI